MDNDRARTAQALSSERTSTAIAPRGSSEPRLPGSPAQWALGAGAAVLLLSLVLPPALLSPTLAGGLAGAGWICLREVPMEPQNRMVLLVALGIFGWLVGWI